MDKIILCLELYHSLLVIGTVVLYPILLVAAFVNSFVNFIRNKVNQKTIAGEVAVVTGSGRGLGRDIAIELAKRGCHVAIVDIQQTLAEDTSNYIAEHYKVKTKAYKINVGDYDQLVELNNSVTKDLGDITILINNAGIMTLSSLKNPPPQEVQQMINVNFTSICYAQEIFLSKMNELNYGHIVNISSLAALLPAPVFKIYSATKSAVRSLSLALRLEIMMEHKNITVTTVMPTMLKTNKRIEKLMSFVSKHNILPIIDGNTAAKYIVTGMLRGAREITIPYSYLNLYRLLEFLPTYAKELWISATISFYYKNVMKSERFAEELKAPDVII